MRQFQSNSELLKATTGYYLANGYSFIQVVVYPEKKEEKWGKIDKKLINKYNMDLNKGQRAYCKRKKQANAVGLRYQNLCIILHTEGTHNWDEKFIDLREKSVKIPFGSVLKIDISVANKKGIIKFTKRSYQDFKEIVKQIAKNPKIYEHANELKKIKHIPAVTRKMHMQKEHLFELYQKECKRHGRKPFML